MTLRDYRSGSRATYDVVIVGAGPAGLAAASRISKSDLRVLLLDAGKPACSRDRHSATELTTGHGGAGLFSDGKFSFFPSASELWRLPEVDVLREAYQWMAVHLAARGLDEVPPFPDGSIHASVAPGRWELKEYRSLYMSLDDRLRLIEDLVDEADVEGLIRTEMKAWSYDHSRRRFELTLHSLDEGHTWTVRARRLLLAGGRFAPMSLAELPSGQGIFRRLEVGFRLEQDADSAFFADTKLLDPKYRLIDDDKQVEWRTFCACRKGETVLSETAGMWTVSGRADGPPTKKSNIGFNTRILDPVLADDAWGYLRRAVRRPDTVFRTCLLDFLHGDEEAVRAVDTAVGANLRRLMQTGVRRLASNFPKLLTGSPMIIGPTIEGVGWYPQLSGRLRSPYLPLWFAGDACGAFRGIVAALVSGHYAASTLLDDANVDEVGSLVEGGGRSERRIRPA